MAFQPQATRDLLLHKRPLNHVLTWHTCTGLAKAPVIENVGEVFQHGGRTTQHKTVFLNVRFWQPQIAEYLAGQHQVRQTTVVTIGFTGNGRIIKKSFTDHFAEVLMLGQLLLDVILIRQFGLEADTVGKDYLVEALVNIRILDDTHKGGEAGSRRQQPQTLARQQVVRHQCSGGFAAHKDLITGLDLLQLGGQRAIGDLDTEKLQLILIVGAGDGVSTQQRAAVRLLQANHGEMAILKAEAGVAAGLEAEQGLIPVMDFEHRFLIQI